MNGRLMKNILKNKLIVISGFGRSGTTILGKVLGSMQPSVYCFEPPIMKYLSEFGLTNVPAKILFETHFLQEIQGRGNMNSNDWSYCENYRDPKIIQFNRDRLKRREDAIKLLSEGDYKFILKGTELQHHFELMHGLFPGVRFVHIIRNGFASVNSAISRGWYTDDYCNSDAVENMIPHFKCDIPCFIGGESVLYWPDWNPETRAACAWRNATADGIRYKNKYPDRCIQFKYEDFISQPYNYAHYFREKFDLYSSRLTRKHIDSIGSYESNSIRDYTKTILEPEFSKFIKLNKKLKYNSK